MTNAASESAPLELKTCVECGADCDANSARCWLCGADLKAQAEIVVAEIVDERPSYAPREGFFALLSALVAIVVLLVGLGAAATDSGMAIFFAIIVVPALVATIVRSRKSIARRGYSTWGEKLATFFISAALVYALINLLAVAVVVALIIYCFYAMSAGNPF